MPSKNQTSFADGQTAVTVLGVGQMGLVCANILAPHHRTASLTLWSHDADEAGSLTQTRASDRLPGFVLEPNARITDDLAAAVSQADLIVSAIPVQFIRRVWERGAPHIRPSTRVVSVAKGIENGTLLRPTQIIADAVGDNSGNIAALAALSGPTIASELARCLPATIIAASDDESFADDLQSHFASTWLRVYSSADTLGVELAGAMKNVIALAAGVIDGLNAGCNAKSALLARGLAEITRLGTAMGAQPDTFFGIAGVGDLATTCFSPEGRNRSCGEALGRGETLDDYLANSTSVVEGVATTRSVIDLAKKHNVEMPITTAIASVLFESVDPIDAIGTLMAREQKPERVG